MRITGTGDILQVARITGPTHNFLRLTFARQDGGPVRPTMIVDQPPALLAEDEVRAAVLQGSDDAGGLADLELCIASVLYVGSDTPTPITYRFLSRALVGQKRANVLQHGLNAHEKMSAKEQA